MAGLKVVNWVGEMAGWTDLNWVPQRAVKMGVSWVETMVVKWVGLMADCWDARTDVPRAG